MGDFKERMGREHSKAHGVMGLNVGEYTGNGNGSRFSDFYIDYYLLIGNFFFLLKPYSN